MLNILLALRKKAVQILHGPTQVSGPIPNRPLPFPLGLLAQHRLLLFQIRLHLADLLFHRLNLSLLRVPLCLEPRQHLLPSLGPDHDPLDVHKTDLDPLGFTRDHPNACNHPGQPQRRQRLSISSLHDNPYPPLPRFDGEIRRPVPR